MTCFQGKGICFSSLNDLKRFIRFPFNDSGIRGANFFLASSINDLLHDNSNSRKDKYVAENLHRAKLL